MNARMQWIDAARGIGIVLVVLGHVWRGLDTAHLIPEGKLFSAIDQAIYLFHMPLFFLISGLLIEGTVRRNGILGSLKNRMEALIYPFLLWSYISATLLFLASSVTNRKGLSVVDVLSYPLPPKDIYWFLAGLFIAQTIASFVVPTRSRVAPLLYFAIASLPALFLDLQHLDVWARKTLETAPFIFVGMAMSGLTISKNWHALLGGVVFVGAQILQYQFQQTNGALHYLLSTGAVMGFVVGAAYLFTATQSSVLVRALSVLGEASMTIYLTHIMAMAFARIVLLKLGLTSLPLHVLLGTAFGIAAPLVFLVVCQRLHLMRLLGLGRPPQILTLSRAPAPQG